MWFASSCQPHYKQSKIATEQWPSGADHGHSNTEKAAEEVKISLSGPVELSCNTFAMVCDLSPAHATDVMMPVL